jgi:ribose transport system substrate-binding protein
MHVVVGLWLPWCFCSFGRGQKWGVMGQFGSARLRTRVLLLVAGGSLVLVACGGGSSSDGSSAPAPSSGGSSAPASQAAAGSCGSVPTVAPNDPQHVLASTLSASALAQYNGYSDPIVPSAWANWKNPVKPPWKIALVLNTLANPFNAQQAQAIKEAMTTYQREGLVSKYTVLSTNDSATTELQDMALLTQQHYNGIILSATSATGVVPAVEAAGAAGIPTVTFFSSVPNKYVVNEGPNPFLFGGAITATIAKELNGKGNVLYVRGTPGLPFDTQSYNAAQKVLSLCPNIHQVGVVNGQWDPSVAKTETLKFLATHPGKIDAVLDSGPGDQQGVMQAFIQAGRPMPIVADVGGMNATLSYWKAHESSYTGAGAAIGPEPTGQREAQMMMRTLLGQGPKLDAVLFEPPAITTSNLDEFLTPGSTLSSTTTANAPINDILPDSYIDGLLNHPGPIAKP